ncbi:hypothetical protein HN51_035730, partial [Arachis hypogaea]
INNHRLVPVGNTKFAKDAAFAYKSLNLRDTSPNRATRTFMDFESVAQAMD